MVLGSVLGQAGCSVGPDFERPAVPNGNPLPPLPAATTSSRTVGGGVQTLVTGADLAGDWWTLFGSPEITARVEQALKANPDLAAAQATLREAKETRRAEEGAYFPSLSATLGDSRQRQSLASFGAGSGSSLYTLYTGTLNVSYSVDLFGSTRRQVEQLGAQADYERFELEAAYLSLTTNLVSALLTEASLKAQIDATNGLIALYRDALTVTQSRLAAGGVSGAELLQQQASLSAEIATLPGLQKQYRQQRNLVARYLGVLPGDYTAATIDLTTLTLPPSLPVSLPSDLVRQRPDIQAAEALLHSASAAVGVATANEYPQFTLTALYGREGSSLFSPAGIVWSLAGSLTQSLFDGGTLRAKRESAVAAFDAAAATYSSTLRTAFQGVADTLVAVDRDAETLKADADSEETARQALTVSRAQFGAGAGTYLALLQAQQTYQASRLTLVSAQAQRFTDTVALFQAVGGGWWNRKDIDPAVDACCGRMP